MQRLIRHNSDSTGSRCFEKFIPFVGQDQSRVFAAHLECTLPPKISLDSRKQRKKRATKFSKRRKTFFKKANDLSTDCEDIDVYVAVRNRRSNQIWEYSNDYVPPTREELVSENTISFDQTNFVSRPKGLFTPCP